MTDSPYPGADKESPRPGHDEMTRFRHALLQLLETDESFGVKSVPIAWPCEPERTPAPARPAHQVQPAVGRQTSQARHAGNEPVLAARSPAHDFSNMVSGAGMTADEKAAALQALDAQKVKSCKLCRLAETRNHTVFGQGNADARLVFVGEGPGFEEDRQGLAFVGRAGQLLTDIIVKGMGITRDDVFICNIVKCRPPGNRDPQADEILACNPYLQQQLMIIEPEVVVALGAPAAKTLLGTAQSIGKLRGRFHDFYPSGTSGRGPSIPLMPTYHPAYLLRNPSEKSKTWEDIQMVMTLLGLERS